MPSQADGPGSLIEALLKEDLHLTDKARFGEMLPAAVGDLGARADIVIRDGRTLYLVELKNLASAGSLAHLAFLKQLLEKGGKDARYVLAAKNIPGNVRDLAAKLGVTVVQLPLGITVGSQVDDGPITTPVAWKVVCAMLSRHLGSINALSKEAGVSYGWAHRTVSRLISMGIAEKLGDQVRIRDLGKLLDAAALERPMAGMNRGIVWTGYSSTDDAASGLSAQLAKSKIGFAFTGFTAAAIYAGSAIRHDAVYLYLDDPDDYRKLKSDEVRNLRGIKIYIYRPDRDVTGDSRMIKGIRIVTMEQALLDMAGFGRSGGTLALELARNHGRTVDNG